MTLGYLIHHTLIAVFFWMSAMSIHVTRTMLNSFNENKSKNLNRMILLNMVYAQGLPFLITIVTIIMDTTVKKIIFADQYFYFSSRAIQKPTHCLKLENTAAGWTLNIILECHSKTLLSFCISICWSSSSSWSTSSASCWPGSLCSLTGGRWGAWPRAPSMSCSRLNFWPSQSCSLSWVN